MSKHTKGPWQARRTGDRWEVVSGVENFEDRSGVVVGWVETSRLGFSHPTDAADAKLMAAAPDLLAVVKSALAALEEVQSQEVADVHDLCIAIRAAIAKTSSPSGCLCRFAISQIRGEPFVHDPRCALAKAGGK